MNEIKKYLVLLPLSFRDRFFTIVEKTKLDKNQFVFAETKGELDEQFNKYGSFDFLISFSTSVIVPEKYLIIPGIVAVNIHAASPEYPGRDPHHYAIYDGATTYGATMHYMTKQVDAGGIIEVELFSITGPVEPLTLMKMANECAWILMEKLLFLIKNGSVFPVSDQKWSSVKRSRKDFIQLCNIHSDIEEAELNRRIKAFHVNGFENLYVEIHGQKFFYKDEKNGSVE